VLEAMGSGRVGRSMVMRSSSQESRLLTGSGRADDSPVTPFIYLSTKAHTTRASAYTNHDRPICHSRYQEC